MEGRKQVSHVKPRAKGRDKQPTSMRGKATAGGVHGVRVAMLWHRAELGGLERASLYRHKVAHDALMGPEKDGGKSAKLLNLLIPCRGEGTGT